MAEAAPSVATGDPDMIREHIAECMHLAGFYATMGVNYASVRDDPGLERSLQQTVAATRSAVAGLRMLVEAKEHRAAERQAEQDRLRAKFAERGRP